MNKFRKWSIVEHGVTETYLDLRLCFLDL